MGLVTVRDAVTKKEKVEKIVKKALRLSECDCCGHRFKSERWCNDRLEPHQLRGTFSDSALGEDGKSLGNMFSATVCSFKCAGKLFAGKWKGMGEYKPYAKANVDLVRVEFGATTCVVDESEAIEAWEEAACQDQIVFMDWHGAFSQEMQQARQMAKINEEYSTKTLLRRIVGLLEEETVGAEPLNPPN